MIVEAESKNNKMEFEVRGIITPYYINLPTKCSISAMNIRAQHDGYNHRYIDTPLLAIKQTILEMVLHKKHTIT